MLPLSIREKCVFTYVKTFYIKTIKNYFGQDFKPWMFNQFMNLISFWCVRSFFGSKSSIHPNIVPVRIPQTNINNDYVQTSSESDDDFDASSDKISQLTMNHRKKGLLNQTANLKVTK